MKEIIEQRTNLIVKAKDNPILQKIEVEMCFKDILYFFKNYLYTEKNSTFFGDEHSELIPFVPFDFQEEYILEVWESIMEGNKPVAERNPDILTNVFIEKSRQMGISRLTAGIFLYWFLFHKHKYTIISRTAEEVDTSWDMDSMFEKLRFMCRNLPTWILPVWFSKEIGKNKTNAYMKITDPTTGASITGKSANPDAGRWGTRNAIFMDEMAFMRDANSINKSAGSNTPCRIFNSTPNGEGNEFFRMRQMCSERLDKYTGTIIKPEIKWLRYHWTEHPMYDQQRFDWKTKGMSKEQIAQELEIDYNTAVKGRVYDAFPTKHVDIEYNQELPLFVWMDNSHGWQDPNAYIVAQPDGVYRNIIDSIEIQQPPEFCAEYLIWQPRFEMSTQQEKFLERRKTYNRRKAIYVSDPYDTKSAMWSSTILDDYKKNWINLMLPQERSKKEQITKTRTNIYRIKYNDNCLDFASAIMNARYPEVKENSNNTTARVLPVHNWTSHYRTALEYGITYCLENPIMNKKRVLEDTRPRRNKLTWRLIYK